MSISDLSRQGIEEVTSSFDQSPDRVRPHESQGYCMISGAFSAITNQVKEATHHEDKSHSQGRYQERYVLSL
jgi:hypothetical protein